MIIEAFHWAGRRAGRGYTLVETLVSVTILAVLMLAMQSVILIAAKAIPNPSSTAVAANGAGRAMDLLSTDLTYATAVTRCLAKEVELKVPDRNQDGVEETIRYSWSGVAGEPLVRTFNGTATTLIDGVRDFQLGYDKRKDEASSPGQSESAEMELVKHTGTGPFLYDYRITSLQWGGEYFKPTLPAGTTSWRITRVTFNARVYGGNGGTTKIQVRTTSGGYPTGTVLDEAILSEASLGASYSQQNVGFTKLAGLTPGVTLCLVMQWQGDTESCAIQYQTQSITSSNAYMVQTYNGGSSWSYQSLWDIPFCVYGTVSTAGPTTYKYYLTSVRCSLKTGLADQSRITTSARVLNEPEVTGG
ncbi:MAG TPA: prepilin-type N-terminal cleavage/methylation domain-containing protein [Tepidisphaeraceae bacterium]|nr:prepilin-type N-terminal cleavage/methylation domain-containing protein [Tepidisphaeraceae bacterium]